MLVNMCEKLWSAGIRGKASDWINSWFLERRQRIVLMMLLLILEALLDAE